MGFVVTTLCQYTDTFQKRNHGIYYPVNDIFFVYNTNYALVLFIWVQYCFQHIVHVISGQVVQVMWDSSAYYSIDIYSL